MARPKSHKVSKEKLKSKWGLLSDYDISEILTDTGKLVARVQERYGLSLEDARQQTTDFLDSVGDAAVEAYDATTDAVGTAARSVEDTIRGNPIAAFAGALLLGGVVGYLIGVSEQDRRRSHWF